MSGDINAGLDARNQLIRDELAAARLNLFDKLQRPLIGDIVHWPNGHVRRISHDLEWELQTSIVGSFFVFRSGHGSFSGALKDAQPLDFFERTGELQEGLFWFFSHNVTGAGRAVDCTLPCRVWRLVPFARDRAQAECHPRALRSLDFWGEGHIEYEKVIAKLMNPPVMRNPEAH